MRKFCILCLLLCVTVSISALDFFPPIGGFFSLGPGISGHTRKGIAIGGGLTLGMDLNEHFSAGLRNSYFHNLDTVSALEINVFFRYYLPWLRFPKSIDGPFVQADLGGVFFFEYGYYEYGEVAPAFSGGLSVGWRINLWENCFIEPSVRAGYPHIWGFGVTIGFKFRGTSSRETVRETETQTVIEYRDRVVTDEREIRTLDAFERQNLAREQSAREALERRSAFDEEIAVLQEEQAQAERDVIQNAEAAQRAHERSEALAAEITASHEEQQAAQREAAEREDAAMEANIRRAELAAEIVTRREEFETSEKQIAEREAQQRRETLAAEISELLGEQETAEFAKELMAMFEAHETADRAAERRSADSARETITLPVIQFMADSAAIPRSELGKLDEVVRILNENPGRSILVIGHSAFSGTEGARSNMSRERAQAAANYLISRGARSASEIIIIGFGSDRPVGNNATREGMAANRRVEFILMQD